MAEKTAQSEAPPSPCKTKSTAVYHTHCKTATRASLHFLLLDWCYFAIFSHYWSRFAQQEAFSLHMGILYFLLDRRLHFLGSCTWQSLTCGSPRLWQSSMWFSKALGVLLTLFPFISVLQWSAWEQDKATCSWKATPARCRLSAAPLPLLSMISPSGSQILLENMLLQRSMVTCEMNVALLHIYKSLFISFLYCKIRRAFWE